MPEAESYPTEYNRIEHKSLEKEPEITSWLIPKSCIQ